MDVRKLKPYGNGTHATGLYGVVERQNRFDRIRQDRIDQESRVVTYDRHPTLTINDLRKQLETQREINRTLLAKLDGYKKVVNRLRQARLRTRRVLGARGDETTAQAAERVRGARPNQLDRGTAEWLYAKWEPVAREETGEPKNVDTWIEGMRTKLMKVQTFVKRNTSCYDSEVRKSGIGDGKCSALIVLKRMLGA